MRLFASPIAKCALPVLVVWGLLRVWFWWMTFPNPDEAYYWLWGQRLGWSYYDHPPLHAWIQGGFAAMLGRSNFVLRLPNVMSNGLLFYTYYQITCYLYGPKARDWFWLTLVLVLGSPLFFLFLALAWNDHWLITLSLLSAYQFIRFGDGYLADGVGNRWWLYGAALALGLAGLCKYNAVFMAGGFLATILSDQRLRRLLRDYRLYLAVAIALTCLSPVLIWNLSNDFQSFQYYAQRSVSGVDFTAKLTQLLVFLLLCVVTFSPINGWALVQVLRQPRRLNRLTQHTLVGPQSNSIYGAVALWVAGISTGTLIVVALLSTAIYYWNILAYLLLFPLLPVAFVRPIRAVATVGAADGRIIQLHHHQAGPRAGALPLRQRMLWSGMLYGGLFAALLVIHYSLVPLSALVSREGDPDSRMLYGWHQVAQEVAAQAEKLDGESLRITTDYRSASALAYAMNQPDVIAISDRIDQFDFWANLNQMQGKDAVIVADDWHPATPHIPDLFQRTSTPVTVSVMRFGVWIKNYYVFKGYGFRAASGSGRPFGSGKTGLGP